MNGQVAWPALITAVSMTGAALLWKASTFSIGKGTKQEPDGDSLDTTASIQHHITTIRTVLHFWFGQAPPDVNQKTLWMVQDPKRLLVVDEEIFDKFCPLMIELVKKDSPLWQEWCEDSSGAYGYHGKVAAIIVLDQFSRHIFRKLGADCTNLPEQRLFDQRALETSKLLVAQHAAEMDTGMIPVPMHIFALMPFRHANELDTVQFVRSQIETKLAPLVEQSDTMVRRFRKATTRRLAVLQDEARRTGHNKGEEKVEFSDQDILETMPFEADLGTTSKHVVHVTISKFLQDRGIYPSTKAEQGTTICTPVVVSLSGGVDSMVIAAVLADMVRSHGYHDTMKVIAVHIDYANRPESRAEAAFVERWCEQQKIDFFCRRIDEVTRGITARDEYEAISRDVRYTFYQKIIRQYEKDYPDVDIAVMLGHHRGDLRENVLSNAHKGSTPLDLSGMTPVSTNNGVTLFRPLLPLEKNEVFHYSHKFGIPYFKDTTPHWSTRGKLRNKLIPLLQEIYGEGCLNNLSQLAVESDQCRALVHSVTLDPFLDQVERLPMGIMFDTRLYKSNDLFFWKFVLRETLHSARLGMFSDKAIVSFLERVQVDKPKGGWLQCRKDYAVYLRDDGVVFVLYPSSFPWRKSDQYHHETQGVQLSIADIDSYQVGPWRIRARISDETLEKKGEWDKLLEKKAVSSMNDFLKGRFDYYLNVPAVRDGNDFKPKPLVFRTFKKSTRPRAWKGVDVKIQETLPLLGHDDSLESAEKEVATDEVSPQYLVKISYRMTSPIESVHDSQGKS